MFGQLIGRVRVYSATLPDCRRAGSYQRDGSHHHHLVSSLFALEDVVEASGPKSAGDCLVPNRTSSGRRGSLADSCRLLWRELTSGLWSERSVLAGVGADGSGTAVALADPLRVPLARRAAKRLEFTSAASHHGCLEPTAHRGQGWSWALARRPGRTSPGCARTAATGSGHGTWDT